jgi:hypothetical protein
VPSPAGSTRPVQRTLKESGATVDVGRPVPQPKFTVGSVRTVRCVVKLPVSK